MIYDFNGIYNFWNMDDSDTKFDNLINYTNSAIIKWQNTTKVLSMEIRIIFIKERRTF